MNNGINYGINLSLGVDASRPISVVSSTPVAMAVTADTQEELLLFTGAKEALAWAEEKNVTVGTLVPTLHAFFVMNLTCPLIVHISTLDDNEDTNISNVLKGLEKFGDTLQTLGLEADLIIAPMYSHNISIAAKLDAIAAKLWGTGIACSFANSETDSVAYLSNFGTRFLHITNGVSIIDGQEVCNSAIIAANIAYWDNGGDNGEDKYGWAKNHSNRVIHGITKSTRKDGSLVQYRPSGDTEARRLRQQGMSHIVRDEGWRVYGFETTSIEPIWQELARARTFHRLGKTLERTLKWIRDREADELSELNKSVTKFFDGLKGAGVLVGFSAYFDPKKNLAVDVTAGKFTLTLKVGDMPSVAELNIELIYSDEWNSLLIGAINGN